MLVSKAVLEGLPARVQDVLNVAWAFRIKQGIPAENFFCDPSQSVLRMPWSTDLRTLTQQSCIFNFGTMQFLGEEDKLCLHGYPVTNMNLQEWHSKAVATWAGDGMFLPCIGACIMGYWLNPYGPWWAERDLSSLSDVGDNEMEASTLSMGSGV